MKFEPCLAPFKRANKIHFARSPEREQARAQAFTYVLLDCDRSRNNVLRPFSS